MVRHGDTYPRRVDPVDIWKRHVPLPYQTRVIEARLTARRLVDGRRQLPEFLVIGGQRCGTSSLYKWLEAHPCVVASLRKETEYLTAHWCKGEAWYRGHFASGPRRRFEHRFRGRDIVSFEASPNYLFHPQASERAARLMPGARIVVLLRNPVDRAYSHYRHEVRAGRETLSFEDALAAESDRLAGEESRMAADPCYRSLAWEHFSYTTRGHYADQLPPWLARFDSERVLIVHSDDLYRDTTQTYLRVLGFLDLPAWSPEAFRNYSYVGAGPAKVRMADATRQRLAERFEPRNRQLYELLGRDFAWESSGATTAAS